MVMKKIDSVPSNNKHNCRQHTQRLRTTGIDLLALVLTPLSVNVKRYLRVCPAASRRVN